MPTSLCVYGLLVWGGVELGVVCRFGHGKRLGALDSPDGVGGE